MLLSSEFLVKDAEIHCSIIFCEAELVAATIGAAEGILTREIFRFVLNADVQLDIRMDSSSARQWLQRSGIGRLKHLAARSLWLQSAVKEKELCLKAIPAQFNLSDFNTKRLTCTRRDLLMFYLPMVRSSEEPLEKIGEEEVYKAVCKRVCQGGQAVVSMTRLVQAVMLLEGIGVRSESQMDQPLAPLRRAGMEYFGYDDMDEFTRCVHDVCLVMSGIFFGTVIWIMWDRLTGPGEPEEEPNAGPPGEPQQQAEPAGEPQQQAEPAGEPQQQAEPAGEPQQAEPAGEQRPGVREGPQQGQYGSPEQVEARLNAWMREEIIGELRRGEEEERLRREREHRQDMERQRQEILDHMRMEARQAEFRRARERDQVEVKVTRAGVCYHLATCPRLRHRRPNNLRTMTRAEAIGQGLRECDQCRA